jgi:hypothetical protein
MANILRPQKQQNVFIGKTNRTKTERTGRDLWQDKYASGRVRKASHQPVMVGTGARTHQSNINPARSKKRSINRKTVQVAAWVQRPIKEELERMAKREGLSLSQTIAALLEEALRQKLHIQHAVLLQPIIEQAIRKQMRAISTRLAHLMVRVAFDAGQTRSLVTNVLGRQPGVNPEILRTILAGSGKSAKANITRRTPQMTELIEAVEKWMETEERLPEMTNGDRKGQLHQKQGRG